MVDRDLGELDELVALESVPLPGASAYDQSGNRELKLEVDVFTERGAVELAVACERREERREDPDDLVLGEPCSHSAMSLRVRSALL